MPKPSRDIEDSSQPTTYAVLPGMDQPEEKASLLPSGARRSAAPPGTSHEESDTTARLSPILKTNPQIKHDNSVVISAAARWKQAVQKKVPTKRFHDAIDAAIERYAPGAAPGVDLRRSSKYQHLAAKWCLPCTVTVVDYDAREVTLHPPLTTSAQLEVLLAKPRDERVRWIHVDGLNWDVIQVLALKYDLHPLATEDTVHVPQRVKADFYDSCLYVSLIYLYLAQGIKTAESDDEAHPPPEIDPEAWQTAGSAPSAAAAPSSRNLPRTISGVRRAAAAEAVFANADYGEPAGPSRSLTGPSFATVGGRAASAIVATNGQHRPVDRHSLSYSGPAHYPLPLRHTSITLHSETWERAYGPAAAGAAARRRGSDGGGPRRSGLSFFGRRPKSAAPGGAAGGGGGGGGGGGSDPGHPHHRGGERPHWVREERAIHVSAQQVSLFLLRGEHPNTLITIFQSDGSAVTEPILEQLKEPRTLVREAEDASFLANLVIDTLVDHIFPVVGAYREQLQQFEQELVKLGPGGRSSLPSAASIGELHAMQRDLRRLDRTIAPLQVVVANMVSRDATARDTPTPADPSTTGPSPGPSSAPSQQLSPSPSGTCPPPAPSAGPSCRTLGSRLGSPPPPFLSRLACTYLGDVRDHVATLCEDLISLSSECGDLIGLIFNLTALQQSQSAQTLTVVSTIFLPITFLAGVYGMNFDMIPELHWTYGYLYFWLTSLAIVVVFVAVMVRAGLLSFR